MDRRSRTRAILASSAAVAVSLCVAPQWASGSDAAPTTPPASVAASPATAHEPAAPVHVASTDEPRRLAAPAPTPTTVIETSTPPTTITAPVAEAAGDTPAPVPEAVAPANATAVTADTIRVEVATTEGASRTVSLHTDDGTPVGGPVAVDGAPVIFDDLAPGTYDVFVEQIFDDGATFLTRTTVTVDGGAVNLTCDAETLDCTIA